MTEGQCRKQAQPCPLRVNCRSESDKYLGKPRQVAAVTERGKGSNPEWKKVRDKTQQD